MEQEEDIQEEYKPQFEMELSDIDDISLSMLLQKINRILSENEKITVKNDRYLSSVGSTDVRHFKIFLNYDSLKQLSKQNLSKFLTITKGVNYHELSHAMFSDMNFRKLEIFHSDKNVDEICSLTRFLNCYNLLEDCRIENMFSAIYDRAKYYFSFAAINILLDSTEDIRKLARPKYSFANYLLLYGRKFLNIDLSDYKSKIINVKHQNIISAEKVVDKYIIEADVDKKLMLVYELTKLLFSDNKQKNEITNISDEHSLESKSRKSGNTNFQRSTTDTLRKVLENKDWEKDELSREVEANENIKEPNRNIKSTNSEEELLKKVEEIIEDSLENVKTEITEDINTLKSAANSTEFSQYEGMAFRPSTTERLESKRIERVLKLLRSDLTSNIKKFQKSGQLDIQSAMKGEKEQSMNIFRKLKLNKLDKSKIGVCILLDSSGSISNTEFKKEISAAWCLSDAFKQLNNKVEVIEFSDRKRLLKSFNDEGDWSRRFCGGTVVGYSLKQAHKDLLALKRKHKVDNLIVIVVSDGIFHDTEDAISEFNSLKKDDIKTVWIFVRDDASRLRSGFEKVSLSENAKRIINSVSNYIELDDLQKLSIEMKGLIIDIQKEINQKIQHGTFY